MAQADRAETQAREVRLSALLAKPASASEEQPLAERVHRSLLTIRLAQARHRISIGQLSSAQRTPATTLGDDQLAQAVPGAPMVNVVPLTIEGTYSTLAGLQDFLDEVLIKGHSLATLKVEGSRFTARIDIYGRQ
jgi:hypothetical protein